jgi:uncharacterized protein (DUF427 family)
VYVEPYRRRIRALIADRTVIDCEQVQLVHRPGRPTSYAFPAAEVPPELADPEPAVAGHVTVAWDRVDAWYEEDEHLRFNRYPKNPYHRVDCLPTHRRLHVSVDGVTIVDTADTLAVFETALAPRLYVSKEAVTRARLTPSATSSWCSYKGIASYWNVDIDGTVIVDAAWSYEDPLGESNRLRSMVCFDDTLVSVSAELPEI